MLAKFAVILCCAGCSMVFVRPPPDTTYPTAGDCTTSHIPPAIDSAFVAVGAIDALQAQDASARVGGWIGVAVWGLSAWYGYHNTAKCAELRGER